MTILVHYNDDEMFHIKGIDRVSPFTLISNVAGLLVWLVRKTFVGGKVKWSIPVCKKELLCYIRIPSKPLQTYKNLNSDAIKHAFGVLDYAGWTVQPDWTINGQGKFVKLTKDWFDVCTEFMKIPTGFVTDKKKYRDVVQVAISEYIMAQKRKK